MKYYILLILFISQILGAKELILHEDCMVKLELSKNTLSSVEEKLKKRLNDNGFTISGTLKEGERLKRGSLIISAFTSKDKGGMFPPCRVKLTLSSIKKEKSGSRKSIFTETKVRRKPRVTIKGTTRCMLALQDSAEFLPFCKIRGQE